MNRIIMKKQNLSAKLSLIPFQFVVCSLIWIVILSPLTNAHAHPHVFIVQRLNLVFDDKGLSGIKVHWKFDDMFASMIAEGHDLNKNGQLEVNEVAAVKQNAFNYISEYSFFSFIKIDNKPFNVKFIKDFNAVLEEKRLVYEFFIHHLNTNLSHRFSYQ